MLILNIYQLISQPTHISIAASDLFDNVISYEAHPETFEICKKRIGQRENIKLFNQAAWHTSDEEMFVKEIFRPSPLDAYQNIVKDFKWIVPEELVMKLLEYDQKPMSLIDLFLLIKEIYPIIKDKEAKKYAIRLTENGLVDVKKAKEYRH